MMVLDPYTPDVGRYKIHSLYFDDFHDNSIFETEAGLSKRYKWRIRYYNDDLNYIVLEKKEKVKGRCHKKVCKINKEEYKCIVSGNITDIVYDTNKDLIKELAADVLTHGFQPKIIIDYERIAYIEEVTNVRVTFDIKVSASSEIDRFLDGDYQYFYIMPSGINILEVKFNYILPSYIKNIIESFNLNQTAFSKYYYSRKVLDYRR